MASLSTAPQNAESTKCHSSLHDYYAKDALCHPLDGATLVTKAQESAIVLRLTLPLELTYFELRRFMRPLLRSPDEAVQVSQMVNDIIVRLHIGG